MISGISKKLIFFTILFVNCTQPGKTVALQKINNIENNLFSEQSLSKITNNKKFSYLSLNNISEIKLLEKNYLDNNSEILLADLNDNQEELIIQADKQSEINDVIYFEGNVSASYKGKLLEADSLIYDKLNKTVNAKGNISLILGEQIFKISQLEYDFISEKGYLLDVEGVINTNTLLEDVSSNLSLQESKKIEELLE